MQVIEYCLDVTERKEAEKEILKKSFVGGLTGRLSDLGIGGRNGVMLAVEEINNAGGISGRPVKLITKDDKVDQMAKGETWKMSNSE